MIERIIEHLGELELYNRKGAYNSPAANVGDDCKCADIIERDGQYFVIGYGRAEGNEYETDDLGPFDTIEEAKEEALGLL